MRRLEEHLLRLINKHFKASKNSCIPAFESRTELKGVKSIEAVDIEVPACLFTYKRRNGDTTSAFTVPVNVEYVLSDNVTGRKAVLVTFTAKLPLGKATYEELESVVFRYTRPKLKVLGLGEYTTSKI